jgi:hypothetical protein
MLLGSDVLFAHISGWLSFSMFEWPNDSTVKRLNDGMFGLPDFRFSNIRESRESVTDNLSLG